MRTTKRDFDNKDSDVLPIFAGIPRDKKPVERKGEQFSWTSRSQDLLTSNSRHHSRSHWYDSVSFGQTTNTPRFLGRRSSHDRSPSDRTRAFMVSRNWRFIINKIFWISSITQLNAKFRRSNRYAFSTFHSWTINESKWIDRVETWQGKCLENGS